MKAPLSSTWTRRSWRAPRPSISGAPRTRRACCRAGSSPGRLGEHQVPPAGLHRRGHRRPAPAHPRRDRRPAGRRPPAPRARRARRDPAAALPQMLAEAPTRHQDAGRPVYIVTAASQEIAEVLARVLVLRRRRSACAPRCATASTPAAPTARSPTARARPRRSASWPRARASTSPSRTPTRTPSPTCRCCAWSATRSPSTRTPRSSGSRARRAGASCASTASRRC